MTVGCRNEIGKRRICEQRRQVPNIYSQDMCFMKCRQVRNVLGCQRTDEKIKD